MHNLKFHRQVIDHLRTEGARDITVEPGGKHHKMRFTWNGKTCVMPLACTPADEDIAAKNVISALNRYYQVPKPGERAAATRLARRTALMGSTAAPLNEENNVVHFNEKSRPVADVAAIEAIADILDPPVHHVRATSGINSSKKQCWYIHFDQKMFAGGKLPGKRITLTQHEDRVYLEFGPSGPHGSFANGPDKFYTPITAGVYDLPWAPGIKMREVRVSAVGSIIMFQESLLPDGVKNQAIAKTVAPAPAQNDISSHAAQGTGQKSGQTQADYLMQIPKLTQATPKVGKPIPPSPAIVASPGTNGAGSDITEFSAAIALVNEQMEQWGERATLRIEDGKLRASLKRIVIEEVQI